MEPNLPFILARGTNEYIFWLHRDSTGVQKMGHNAPMGNLRRAAFAVRLNCVTVLF